MTLPVNLRDRRIDSLSLDFVELMPAANDSESSSYSDLAQLGLGAFDLVPGIEIRIATLRLPWLPDLVDVAWRTTTSGQTVSFDVDEYTVEAAAERSAVGYAIEAAVETVDGADALSLAGEAIERSGDTLMTADAEVSLEPWFPVLRALGAVPPEIDGLSGAGEGRVAALLSSIPGMDIAFDGSVRPYDDVRVVYLSEDDTSIDTRLTGIDAFNWTFGYPSLGWTASVAAMSAAVKAGDYRPIPLTITDAQCDSDAGCELVVGFEERAVSADDWGIERIRVSAPVSVEMGETMRFSSTEAMHIEIKGIRVGGRVLPLLTLSGEIKGDDQRYSASMDLRAGNGITANVMAGYDPVSGDVELRLADGLVDFGVRNAADIFRSWDHEWDVLAGALRLSGSATWRPAGQDASYSGTLNVDLDGLAGRYQDMAFTGLEAETVASVEGNEAIAVQAFDTSMKLFDIGFPVENIRARVAPDLANTKVSVTEVSMGALGGVVRVDPFEYSIDAERNRLVVRPAGIQLPLIVDLVDSEALSVEGSVSGQIPVTISEQGMTAVDGRIENDPPGGAIRLRSGIPGLGASDDSSQVGIVTKALSNFEFESLTSDVTYTIEGDLLLQMRMEGVNPEMDPNQPVVLNLELENNVPQLLKSLQAARSISDILGRKFAN